MVLEEMFAAFHIRLKDCVAGSREAPVFATVRKGAPGVGLIIRLVHVGCAAGFWGVHWPTKCGPVFKACWCGDLTICSHHPIIQVIRSMWVVELEGDSHG